MNEKRARKLRQYLGYKPDHRKGKRKYKPQLQYRRVAGMLKVRKIPTTRVCTGNRRLYLRAKDAIHEVK